MKLVLATMCGLGGLGCACDPVLTGTLVASGVLFAKHWNEANQRRERASAQRTVGSPERMNPDGAGARPADSSGGIAAGLAERELAHGLESYRNGQYREALLALRRSLAGGSLTPSERADAYEYAAAAAHWLGNTEEAATLLRGLFSESPGARLDAATFPPEMCAFAERVRGSTPRR